MASDDPTKGPDADAEDSRRTAREPETPREERPGEPTMRDTTDAHQRIDALEDRIDELTAALEDAEARIDALHRARRTLFEELDDVDERVEHLETTERLEEVTA